MMRIVVVVLAAAIVSASALAAHSTGSKAGAVCPTPSPDGCVIDKWPSVPNKFSQAVAKAAFTHNYGAVWGYLHPKLQTAVSETSWQNCQKRNPITSAGVKIASVKIADSRAVPIALPVLGKQRVRTITLQVLFTAPGGAGQQIAIQYAYWVQDKGNWKAVWLPDQYSVYKSGKCDSGPQRGLY